MEKETSSVNILQDTGLGANPAYMATPKLGKEFEMLVQAFKLLSTTRQHGLAEPSAKCELGAYKGSVSGVE
jgi:hypothetical protein